MNIYNPLLISLLIYIPISVFLFYSKPSFIFDDNNDNTDNTDENNSNNNSNIFKRNKNVIFILLPFVIYGLSSIYVSHNIRKNYCGFLKQKNLKIKDLMKKCKA